MKFTELNLPEKLLKGLNKIGFEELTPVQEQTYPLIMGGDDICALAETGSGKTAACAIPLVQMVDPKDSSIQAVVVVPTRELCLQYVQEISDISQFMDIGVVSIFGGSSKDIQRAELNHKAHVIVATPGRLIDFLYEGAIDFSNVKCAILDEADELLNEGFLNDVKFILSCIRREHQTLLFSATMAKEIQILADECLNSPKQISLISKQASPKSIEHRFCFVNHKSKEQKLVEYLKQEDATQAIIFCNARHLVDKLHSTLKRTFQGVDYIHAGLPQDKRTIIFDKFKRNRIKYMIATDVAGRGLDFSHVSHVINWDMPSGEESYTHRTGRTGRMGKKGVALTFVTNRDVDDVRKVIERKKISPVWLGQNPCDKSTPVKKNFPSRKKNTKQYPPK